MEILVLAVTMGGRKTALLCVHSPRNDLPTNTILIKMPASVLVEMEALILDGGTKGSKQPRLLHKEPEGLTAAPSAATLRNQSRVKDGSRSVGQNGAQK